MKTLEQPAAKAKPLSLDYSLTGVSASQAIEKGLAEADWYQCPVPPETMRSLLQRRDGPAIRDTLLWFALIFASGYITWRLWGHWYAVFPYLTYAVLYASTSDSRWHEAGHGTAFYTDWMNNALYELASFMVLRESTVWRWSHTRHHSDTIIVGRDPEIAVPRPANIGRVIGAFFNLRNYVRYFRGILRHSFGRMDAAEKTYIPEEQFSKIFFKARIYLTIYLSVIALSIAYKSFLPIMYIGFSNFFGNWLLTTYGLTQHAGLAENVLDHRLNCRTVYMGPIHRFLYWNMGYHIEHHMFPLVPYHSLSRLHDVVKDDCPTPYPSIWAAYKEIVPTLLKQTKDAGYHVKRKLPDTKPLHTSHPSAVVTDIPVPNSEGWVDVCATSELETSSVRRFDCGRKTFAICRDSAGKLFATDGICTHGNIHLAGGLVKDDIIECPKHNGRYHLADGSPARAPICRGLATYPVAEENGLVSINIHQAGGVGARQHKTYEFEVVSNDCVATFIKELVLIPVNGNNFTFTPGDYIQFDIPPYESIRFRDFHIPEPYRSVWERQHVFDLVATNANTGTRNNYSLASNGECERILRFNVRIATPPPGQDCAPGVGSSYIWSLNPGDRVTGIGPFGDFHIKPTLREMVYIGGGAGMAPLRAHLSSLLETEATSRKISFWYGARSTQEIFYENFFQHLAAEHKNFSFHLALSAPQPEDAWTGATGFIHEVLFEQYLADHPNPTTVEYYLCGPPMMIRACNKMLAELGIASHQIAYDEF